MYSDGVVFCRVFTDPIPNKPIFAGRTKGSDVITLPASLGHLARGASAIPAWRRSEE
jgi:hypothetical protein